MCKRKVLIPLDGSAFSQQIVPQACDLLDPTNTEIILLRVVPMPEGHVGAPPRIISANWLFPMYETERDTEEAQHPIYATQEMASLESMLQDELTSEVHRIQDAGFTVSVAVRFGDAAEEIATFVANEHVRLVAMATHGRSGLSRMVLGSVAEATLHTLAVPLLLLRPFAYDAQADAQVLDEAHTMLPLHDA